MGAVSLIKMQHKVILIFTLSSLFLGLAAGQQGAVHENYEKLWIDYIDYAMANNLDLSNLNYEEWLHSMIVGHQDIPRASPQGQQGSSTKLPQGQQTSPKTTTQGQQENPKPTSQGLDVTWRS